MGTKVSFAGNVRLRGQEARTHALSLESLVSNIGSYRRTTFLRQSLARSVRDLFTAFPRVDSFRPLIRSTYRDRRNELVLETSDIAFRTELPFRSTIRGNTTTGGFQSEDQSFALPSLKAIGAPICPKSNDQREVSIRTSFITGIAHARSS